MGCFHSKMIKEPQGYEDPTILAGETAFSVSEVEALYELFKKISSSIFNDGLIHKEEFQLALFKSKRENLFADRLHSNCMTCVRQGILSGKKYLKFILFLVSEVKQMVIALLSESDMNLSDDVIESILDKVIWLRQSILIFPNVQHPNQSILLRMLTQSMMGGLIRKSGTAL
ncbi:hypothetical protein CY35_08G095800 [Sphagnum magellanicum]|nr:hypothetical protein CY35_08G095800 [Sphagnum magellanicum]